MEDQNQNELEEFNPESVLEFYNHVKLIVEAMEEDALKNNKGNKAAGVRLRKSLRLLKKKSGEFVKFTLES